MHKNTLTFLIILFFILYTYRAVKNIIVKLQKIEIKDEYCDIEIGNKYDISFNIDTKNPFEDIDIFEVKILNIKSDFVKYCWNNENNDLLNASMSLVDFKKYITLDHNKMPTGKK